MVDASCAMTACCSSAGTARRLAPAADSGGAERRVRVEHLARLKDASVAVELLQGVHRQRLERVAVEHLEEGGDRLADDLKIARLRAQEQDATAAPDDLVAQRVLGERDVLGRQRVVAAVERVRARHACRRECQAGGRQAPRRWKPPS